jgi:hypothetical protein
MQLKIEVLRLENVDSLDPEAKCCGNERPLAGLLVTLLQLEANQTALIKLHKIVWIIQPQLWSYSSKSSGEICARALGRTSLFIVF